jgi:hypothetical protein
MKRWLLAIGLIFIFFGIVITFDSYQSEKTITYSPWQIVKTSPQGQMNVSADFTVGERVELIVTPMSDWTNKMEPPVGDMQYSTKDVWINVTDPRGGVCEYDILFINSGGSVPSFYNVTKLFIGGGFDGDTSNDTLNSEKAIVGNPTYNGTYVAKYAGILPGGGSYGPLTLEKQDATVATNYPYRSYIVIAITMFILGVALLLWGARPSTRRISRRSKRGKKGKP